MRYVSSSAPSPRSSKGRGAFSLLEVAIALVIFVIGAIALLRIFPSGLNVLENSANRRIAAQMSQNVLTSYNSGDLASTTPDAIYDFDPAKGDWNDYPTSALGLRRQAGTVPIGPDDFNSAKDAMKHIQGEKQGVFGGMVFVNNIADGRVLFYKEGFVDGVTIDQSGQLDFRNALYTTANRSVLDSSTTKIGFRQPYLDEVEGVPNSSGIITLERPTDTTSSAYTISWPFRKAASGDSISDITGTAVATGANDCTASAITASGDNLVCTITVPRSSTQPDQYFNINFTAASTASLRRASFVCRIVGPQGQAAGTTPPAPSAVLPIRAPNQLRTGCVYYVSSTWNSGANGAFDQPMVIPTDYVQGGTTALVPSKVIYSSADRILLAPLHFRQYLGGATSTRDGAPLTIPTDPAIVDADGSASTTGITRVSLEYNVREWEFISEDVSQFGTPFAGSADTDTIPNTPEGMVIAGFMNGDMKLADVREIRTRVGNLRGVVQVRGFYGNDQTAQVFGVSFNTNGSSSQTASATKALAKQGRLYLPAVSGGLPLSHARIYYRSKDAWVQQIAVSAPHYLPSAIGSTSTPREQWREFVQGNDKVLYFHATEAGKTVEVLHGATLATATVSTIEIRPDVLIGSSSAPAGFAAASYSRDRITDTIFDVRRPTGTSGISVRTMWLDGTRYAQEIAQ